MKKNVNPTAIISTVLCLAPVIFGIAVYDKLPAQVATHFDAHGTANGWMPRALAVFGLPIFFAVMNAVVLFSLANDPKRRNISSSFRALIRWFMPTLALVIYPVTLLISLGKKIDITMAVNALVGIVFVVCGNYLPKSRRNYTVGIKLPWTLDNDDNWNRTHRLAGFLWVAGGIVMIASTFLPRDALMPILVGVLCVIVGVPAIYSFALYKKNARQQNL
jgi:uncharacterized membrane protein